MKKQMLIYAMLLFSFASFAQGQLKFAETTHEFGQVSEQGGPVSHKFIFTNTGNAPVIISNVQASCGCTTPDWSKDPVAPGKQGFILAQYNPSGRPGSFHKTLTITSNTEPANTTIFIKGDVVSAESATQPAATTAKQAVTANETNTANTYLQYFPYNQKVITAGDAKFQTFINYLVPLIQKKGSVTLAIESSASNVPTDKFKRNQDLAKFRAKEAKFKIVEALKKKGVDASKVKFEAPKTAVQGPPYKKDFKENIKTYEQFQYIKIAVM